LVRRADLFVIRHSFVYPEARNDDPEGEVMGTVYEVTKTYIVRGIQVTSEVVKD
jgi:hypothetical protein